jgi:cystathionine beta-lyase
MIYNFDTFPDRCPTESVKWHKYEPGVLPLWVADMDFVSPEPVIRALRKRVEQGTFGYGQDQPGLKEAIVDRMADQYGWLVQPDEILFIPGVVVGFNLACHAMAIPGGEVLIQTPVYFPFLSAAENSGMCRQDAILVRLPDGSYAIDWELFEKAITPETRIFILCSPHNPVGRVWSRAELERLAGICLRHGITICSDEIHCDLVFRGARHIPTASLDPEISAHTITLMAPSKTFNIPGLDCSFAIIQNPELRKCYQDAKGGLVGGVNILGQVAALAAYREGQEWLDQLLPYLECNRDVLLDYIQSEIPSIHMAKPEGTYLAWLNCRDTGITARTGCSPADFFLKEARVALNDGAAFGKGGEGFVRLNFGCPRGLLLEALERMKFALQTL